MIQHQQLLVTQIEGFRNGGFVHEAAGYGSKTKGRAGQIDILGYITGIYIAQVRVEMVGIALVAHQYQTERSILH